MKKFEYIPHIFTSLCETIDQLCESDEQIALLVEGENLEGTRDEVLTAITKSVVELHEVSEAFSNHLQEAADTIKDIEVDSTMKIDQGFLIECAAEEIDLIEECFMRLPKRVIRNKHRVLVDRDSLDAISAMIPRLKRKVKQNSMVIETDIHDLVARITKSDVLTEDMIFEATTSIEYIGSVLEAYSDYDMSFLAEAVRSHKDEEVVTEAVIVPLDEKTLEEVIRDHLL